MAVEVNLRSKILYKAQLYLLKVIPMVMAFICLLNTIVSYYGYDWQILAYRRASFDNYVRSGKLPQDRKQDGFKELSWTKKDLDEFIKRCKKK